MKYKQDTNIDKFALDEELIVQADLSRKYGELWADALDERDTWKNRLELLKAEKSLHIRSNFKDYEFDTKPTEDAIKAMTLRDPKIQEAQKELQNANKVVNKLVVARESIEQKGRRLDRLVDLWKLNYWADPLDRINIDSMQAQSGRKAIMKELNENPRLRRRKNG